MLLGDDESADEAFSSTIPLSLMPPLALVGLLALASLASGYVYISDNGAWVSYDSLDAAFGP